MKLKKIISAALSAVMLIGCVMVGSAAAATEGELPFADVGPKKWFYDEVKYVYENGLMNGVSAT